MWPKRLSEISRSDIEAVLAARRQEGLSVEFKSGLHKGKEGPSASKAVAGELVALANSYGGTLILGVDEDGDKRASGLVVLPDCRGLAERLTSAIADVVDPPLPGFECVGIEMQDDGAGVVVMRVPASIMGPHWVKDGAGGTCYSRSDTQSRPTSMRVIHQLVLVNESQKSRVGQLVQEAVLRIKEFEAWSDERFRGLGGTATARLSLLLVAVPIAPIQIPDVIVRSSKRSAPVSFPVLDAPSGRVQLPWGSMNPIWRPRMRGVQIRDTFDNKALFLDEGGDGTIGTCLHVFGRNSTQGHRTIAWEWVLALLASTLVRAERARRDAGVPETEYVLRCSLAFTSGWRLVPPGVHHEEDGELLERSPMAFPDYVVGAVDTFDALCRQFGTDIFNELGVEQAPSLHLDWPAIAAKALA